MVSPLALLRFHSGLEVAPQVLGPLKLAFEGIADEGSISYETALSTIDLPGLRVVALHVRRRAEDEVNFNGLRGTALSRDQVCALTHYAAEEADTPLYKAMNDVCYVADRNLAKPYARFMWLLLQAMDQLPPFEGRIVFRGIQMDLSDTYRVNREITWYGFTSTTVSIETMKGFLGDAGSRTLIVLNLTQGQGRSISAFSKFSEDEVLLPPTTIRVTGSYAAGHGLTVLFVEELPQPAEDVIMRLQQGQHNQLLSTKVTGNRDRPDHYGLSSIHEVSTAISPLEPLVPQLGTEGQRTLVITELNISGRAVASLAMTKVVHHYVAGNGLLIVQAEEVFGDEMRLIEMSQNQQLLDLIQVQYPTIRSLLREDPLSTLRMLRKRDAVIAKQATLEVQVEHDGVHPRKSWQDYLDKLKQWIHSINRDGVLERARNHTAEYIHKAHYERYPLWPPAKKEQMSFLLLSTQTHYQTDDNCIVMCVVSGDAEVKDVHEINEGVHKYLARVEGQPVFRVLCTVPAAMQEIENATAGHFHEALEQVRQKYSKSASCIEDL